MSPANEPRKSKAERTAEAREKARQIREEQLKKDKRNKLLIGWGIVVAVVAILAVVALVVSTGLKNNAPVADQGPTPANGNVHGGVTLLKGS
jgi:flagellar basal body-associated protein FliL